MIKRRKIDDSVEKHLLLAAIVSKDFLSDTIEFLKLDYFKSPHIQTAMKWCFLHFNNYGKAPFMEIQSIFETEKLETEEHSALSKIFDEVATRYKIADKFNTAWYIDKAEKYATKRALEISIGNVQFLLEKDQVDDAVDTYLKFKKAEKPKYEFENPFDDKTTLETMETVENPLFRFAGPLGDFLGDFDRGWCVGVSAGFKKGKSLFMDELLLEAMTRRLKVVAFNVEIPKPRWYQRLYKHIVSGHGEGGPFPFPCFDCKRNQDNTCDLPMRTNHIRLLELEKKPEFNVSLKYRPCTECRFRDNREYIEESWFETIERPGFDTYTVVDQMKSFFFHYGQFIRTKSYPRFSVGMKAINRDLDLLAEKEGFIPDVIIIDYLDVLRSDEGLLGPDKHDHLWMQIAGMAEERYALTVTGTQINKTGQTAETQSIEHSAQWVGKFGHVDVMCSLNQTSDEKKAGRMRVGKLAHRHDEFNPEDTHTILQNLKLGQFYLKN